MVYHWSTGNISISCYVDMDLFIKIVSCLGAYAAYAICAYLVIKSKDKYDNVGDKISWIIIYIIAPIMLIFLTVMIVSFLGTN